MNLAAQYRALRDLLHPWRDVWGFSVLKSWDVMQPFLGEELLEAFRTKPLSFQYQFLIAQPVQGLPASMQELQESLGALQALPKVPGAKPILPPFDEGLNPKKNHEISVILGFLRRQQGNWQQLLDIGGGAGHLARHLAAAFKLSTYSVDREALFQEQGRRLLLRRPWKKLIEQPFQFITGEFPNCLTEQAELDLSKATLSVGLHTCGPLAWDHLTLATKGIDLLNFGCCYDKLNVESDTERSSFAQNNSLAWTSEGLFLVTRGGKLREYAEFEFQHRVQEFRFALHHLMSVEFSCQQFVSVGQTSPHHYRGSFAAYVRNRLGELGLSTALSDMALEDFLKSRQILLQEQWIAALLRNRLARPLELLLLLDRGLWLEERGLKVELHEFFDLSLSPRNIGIFVCP